MKYAQCRLAVPTLDQLASAALYQVGPEYFAATREEYKRRRDTVVRKLQQIPGVVCKCPKGAFYLMAALPVDDADTFQQWLLEEFEDHGDTVMFAPGEPFYGTPGKGKNEIRIAYVLKQQDLSVPWICWRWVSVPISGDKEPQPEPSLRLPFRQESEDMMMFQGYDQQTVDFLWGIRFNNDRSWFQEHKEQYQTHLLAPHPCAGGAALRRPSCHAAPRTADTEGQPHLPGCPPSPRTGAL